MERPSIGIDPRSGVPAYRQIAGRLRERISAGDLQPGDRLPSEADLMRSYSAARATVRQAVGLLRSEGLVYAEQGRGAFVRDGSSGTAAGGAP
jgi:GntR family transcriptional regulator